MFALVRLLLAIILLIGVKRIFVALSCLMIIGAILNVIAPDLSAESSLSSSSDGSVHNAFSDRDSDAH